MNEKVFNDLNDLKDRDRLLKIYFVTKLLFPRFFLRINKVFI